MKFLTPLFLLLLSAGIANAQQGESVTQAGSTTSQKGDLQFYIGLNPIESAKVKFEAKNAILVDEFDNEITSAESDLDSTVALELGFQMLNTGSLGFRGGLLLQELEDENASSSDEGAGFAALKMDLTYGINRVVVLAGGINISAISPISDSAGIDTEAGYGLQLGTIFKINNNIQADIYYSINNSSWVSTDFSDAEIELTKTGVSAGIKAAF